MTSPAPLKIVIAAGGTGGTLYPGIAIAQAITRRLPQAEVVFVGAGRAVEARALGSTPWRLITMTMPRIKDRSLWGRLGTLLTLPLVLWRATLLVWRLQPTLAIGIGGYAAGPVPLAAALQRIPMVIVVPDTIPGLANRLLAHFARRIFLGFAEAARFFSAEKICITGNPVRSEVVHVASERNTARRDRLTIFCFGGSQGARSINQAMVAALDSLRSVAGNIRCIHQVGMADDGERMRAAYRAAGIEAEVHLFIDRMWEYYAQADVVIARAGASTIAELLVLAKPAILIPYPHAADDHQRSNAECVVRLGGAVLLLEHALNGDRLAAEIRHFITEPWRLEKMQAALHRAARPDAAERIVEECEKLMRAA